jgi:hypothetical protein
LLFPNGREEMIRKRLKEDREREKNDFPLGRPATVPVPAPTGTFLADMCNQSYFNGQLLNLM